MVNPGTALAGLQWLPVQIDSPISSLAADTAAIVDQSYGAGNLKRAFLCKQIFYNLSLRGGNVGEVGLLAIVGGGADIASFELALTTTIPDPNDVETWGTIAAKRQIWWETLRLLLNSVTTSGNSAHNEIISIGGGKGIPMTVDQGVAAMIFNPSTTAAFAAGTRLVGQITYVGIWMNDV